jgi:hypothetical protein
VFFGVVIWFFDAAFQLMRYYLGMRTELRLKVTNYAPSVKDNDGPWYTMCKLQASTLPDYFTTLSILCLQPSVGVECGLGVRGPDSPNQQAALNVNLIGDGPLPCAFHTTKSPTRRDLQLM